LASKFRTAQFPAAKPKTALPAETARAVLRSQMYSRTHCAPHAGRGGNADEDPTVKLLRGMTELFCPSSSQSLMFLGHGRFHEPDPLKTSESVFDKIFKSSQRFQCSM